MTTPVQAERYRQQYLAEIGNRKVAVFNPHDKPVEDLPVIYGFNNSGSRNFLTAQLIAEDGTGLGSHLCSHESYMPGDLGVLEGTREDRHEGFRKHYPDGYRMHFIGLDNVRSHPGLDEAYRKNQEKRREEEAAKE